MNPLVPFSILFLLPLCAIAAILHLDDGIDPALGKVALVTAAILIVLGVVISFVASRLADRSSH